MFENLCVGDSIFFKLKMKNFYSGFFQEDTLHAKSDIDSLHINLVISSNDVISQNQFENQLIKEQKIESNMQYKK